MEYKWTLFLPWNFWLYILIPRALEVNYYKIMLPVDILFNLLPVIFPYGILIISSLASSPEGSKGAAEMEFSQQHLIKLISVFLVVIFFIRPKQFWGPIAA